MKKLLSVIIPSCNMEKYISGCLESMVGVAGVEALVINDGSKDATSRIAHEFAEKYSETVRVVDKPNGHYGSCINAGLPLATGTYVKVLDADDRFDREALKELVDKLPGCDERGIDVVFTDYVLVREGGGAEHRVGCGLPEGGVFGIEALVAFKRPQVMHTITYRTKILQTMGYRQTEGMPYTDNEWALKPMWKMGKMVYYPLPLYRYLVGRVGQSVSPEQSVKNVHNHEIMAEHMLAEAQRDDISELFRDYALKFVLDNVRLVYEISFFALPKKEGLKKLKSWENRLKTECPKVFAELAQLEMDSRFRAKYIAGWRSRGLSSGLYRRTLRLVKWAIDKQRRMRGL